MGTDNTVLYNVAIIHIYYWVVNLSLGWLDINVGHILDSPKLIFPQLSITVAAANEFSAQVFHAVPKGALELAAFNIVGASKWKRFPVIAYGNF